LYSEIFRNIMTPSRGNPIAWLCRNHEIFKYRFTLSLFGKSVAIDHNYPKRYLFILLICVLIITIDFF